MFLLVRIFCSLIWKDFCFKQYTLGGRKAPCVSHKMNYVWICWLLFTPALCRTVTNAAGVDNTWAFPVMLSETCALEEKSVSYRITERLCRWSVRHRIIQPLNLYHSGSWAVWRRGWLLTRKSIEMIQTEVESSDVGSAYGLLQESSIRDVTVIGRIKQ